MSDPADIAARTQRFHDAARAFTPPSPSRDAKLLPLKDGIVELRQKGASLRLIRELLATVDVAVGTDTIARFLAEVTGDSTTRQPTHHSSRRRTAVRRVNHHQSEGEPVIITPSAERQAPVPTAHNEPPAERPRTRGPRIADPRNL